MRTGSGGEWEILTLAGVGEVWKTQAGCWGGGWRRGLESRWSDATFGRWMEGTPSWRIARRRRAILMDEGNMERKEDWEEGEEGEGGVLGWGEGGRGKRWNIASITKERGVWAEAEEAEEADGGTGTEGKGEVREGKPEPEAEGGRGRCGRARARTRKRRGLERTGQDWTDKGRAKIEGEGEGEGESPATGMEQMSRCRRGVDKGRRRGGEAGTSEGRREREEGGGRREEGGGRREEGGGRREEGGRERGARAKGGQPGARTAVTTRTSETSQDARTPGPARTTSTTRHHQHHSSHPPPRQSRQSGMRGTRQRTRTHADTPDTQTPDTRHPPTTRRHPTPNTHRHLSSRTKSGSPSPPSIHRPAGTLHAGTLGSCIPSLLARLPSPPMPPTDLRPRCSSLASPAVQLLVSSHSRPRSTILDNPSPIRVQPPPRLPPDPTISLPQTLHHAVRRPPSPSSAASTLLPMQLHPTLGGTPSLQPPKPAESASGLLSTSTYTSTIPLHGRLMASFRGERFNVDLSSADEDAPPEPAVVRPRQTPAAPLPAFVKDIQEKLTTTSTLPAAPNGDRTCHGFPVHKKRVGVSRFKQARSAAPDTNIYVPHAADQPLLNSPRDGSRRREEEERSKIDEENRQRIAQMSAQEIEEERRELMQGLPPSLIQRLLRRANIDDNQPTDFPLGNDDISETGRGVSSEGQKIPPPDDAASIPPPHRGQDDQSERPHNEADLEDDEDTEPTPPILPPMSDSRDAPLFHFPRPPATSAPTLDPSSPNFLSDLHSKYFPDLPADPSKLAWMTSTDPSTDTSWSSYSPTASSVPVSALRFSFTGTLIPPSISATIPTTKGLHHHGDSPGSAGYTVAELAHLARSSFPSQRCFAFQTLGRLLYRLGIGEFRQGEEGDSIERGLWGCVRTGRVLETLQEEAARAGGHASSKAYAVDALWLWSMGGGGQGEVKAQ